MGCLKTLNLEITKKCNLKCKHCGAECSNDKSIDNELTSQEINKLLDNVTELGCKTLIIAGGEPFLSNNIWEVLDKAHDNKLRVSILTNGLLIDDNVCHRLSKLSNIEFVRLSLEYPSNKMMEKFRGGTRIVEKVIDDLQLLEKYGIPTGVGMTILPDNIDYIKDIADIAYENGAKFFRAIPVVPTGAAKEMDISEEFYIEALKEVTRLSQTYPRPNDTNNNTSDINNIITACPSGNSSISVSSDGFIGLCPIVGSEKNLGSIKYRTFLELYEELRSIKDKYDKKVKKNCAKCNSFQECRGGCLIEKISRPLNVNQEICVKSIISKVKGRSESQSLFYEHMNFASTLCEYMKLNNMDMCFRALPIWTIFF